MTTEAAASGGSAALPSSAYADAFVTGPPRESAQRVQTRLHKSRILVEELADYFSARRELESSYLKALQKLAKRTFLSDVSALGPNFSPVYERLISEIGETASIHGVLERKLGVECEQPMRGASSQGEWARIKEHDDNLSSTLREISALESQLAKDQKRAEGASSKKATQAQQKVAETDRSLKQTMEVWDAEAPFAFEAYQRIDTQRLELMKEIVTRFETIQSDAAQHTMAMCEQSMQVVLNFDPQTDMQEFLLKSGTARSGAARLVTSHAHTSEPTAEFGRPVLSSSASGRSIDRNGQTITEQSTPSKTGGSTLKSALTRFGRGRSNRNANETSQPTYGALQEGPSDMAPPMSPRRAVGDDSTDSRLVTGGAIAAGGAAAVGAGLMAPLTPTRAQSDNASAVRSEPPQVDAEGFSVPPPDRKPWETGAVSSSPGVIEVNDPMQEASTKMTGMSIAQAPISQDSDQDKAAFERMRSTLLTSRSPNVPQRRNTTRRDRRDVRNTTFNPLMDDGNRPMSTFGVPEGTSPTTQAGSTFVGAPGIGPGRSQSIVSNGSMSNIGNTTLDSVSVGSGLNAYINERVNVVTNGRQVTKMMVVGEINVSLKDVATYGKVHLRIDAFEQLEKAAPNPQFLQELGTDQPGEYTMDIASLAQHTATGSSGKVTILKYQVHVPQHKYQEYVPFHVLPQWRCEPHQTSILINYSANPESRLASTQDAATNATIQGVTMSTEVTSSEVSNIMSKPSASYVAEQKRLFWRLPDPIAISSSTSQKALARFQVDTPSEARPIEIRWKIPGVNMSSIALSLTDSPALQLTQTYRQTVSGKYLASP